MTSSSPSGLHYILWKAAAEQEKTCVYYAAMMSLPFQYAFANSRWTTEIDVMLEKIRRVKKIHQMKITGLVKADLIKHLR